MQLAGKTFLITGGASGLGAGCATSFSGAGANVVILDLQEQEGQALAAQIGEQAYFVRTDVTDEASVQQAIDGTRQRFGDIHGVINCAGIAIARTVVSRDGPHPLNLFTKVIQVNLIGTFNVIRLVAATMMTQEPIEGTSGERGVIINTASVAAFDGQIGQAAYSASKGGVASLTLPLAREFARWGIRVMTIAPGTFETPMLAGLPEAARASLALQVPFPSRLGRPDEYAALARHIAENEMLNGETVIRLDGAIRMQPK